MIFFRALALSLLVSSIALAGEVTVQSCSDGDTCTIQVVGLSLKARLVGIDAPEVSHRGRPGQPFGEEAKKFVNQQVAGQKVEAQQYGIDAYNRVLLILTKGSVNINEALIKSGLAEVYEGKTTYDTTRMKQIQNEAKMSKRGIWSFEGRYQSPYIFRKMKRLEKD